MQSDTLESSLQRSAVEAERRKRAAEQADASSERRRSDAASSSNPKPETAGPVASSPSGTSGNKVDTFA